MRTLLLPSCLWRRYPAMLRQEGNMRLRLITATLALSLAATVAAGGEVSAKPGAVPRRPNVIVNGDGMRIIPAQRYPAARRLLIRHGFDPVHILDAGAEDLTPCARGAEEPCRAYPEQEACASDA